MVATKVILIKIVIENTWLVMVSGVVHNIWIVFEFNVVTSASVWVF
jgi:hypothetical protein